LGRRGTSPPEVDRPTARRALEIVSSRPPTIAKQAPSTYASTASPYDELDPASQERADAQMLGTIDALTSGNGLAWAVYLRNVADGASLSPVEGAPAPKLHPGILQRLNRHIVALRDAHDDGDEERLAREKLTAVRTVREIMAATINELNERSG
jgi:hypothetical protein